MRYLSEGLPVTATFRIASARGLGARCAVAILAASLFGGVAAAQTAGSGAGQPVATPNTPAADPIPDDVFVSALAGRQGLNALAAYLGVGTASPEEVARRASALIRALGQRRGTLAGDQVLGAVDRVSRVASRSISQASIVRLAVDDNFRPTNATVALDFGPQDGNVMPGFERVVAGDSRISGDGINALRRPEENPLLADGLAGISKIEVNVPNGRYRIVLMTQNLNDKGLTQYAFGQVVLINGVPIQIGENDPESWLPEAMLSNPDIAEVSGGPGNGGSFLTGSSQGRASSLFLRQQGGAIILEGVATGGKLTIELRGFGGAKSYMTGLIVEPLEQVSSILLSETARRSVVPTDTRVALESQILEAAASAVEGIVPAEGNPNEDPLSQTPNSVL
tara:strand:- start:3710 stop:4894 length:1185 start_codon:yes stop_codon:yes gene_type:complete